MFMSRTDWSLVFAGAFAASLAVEPLIASPNSDPSLHTELGGLCSWNITCANVAARIRWSPNGASCFNDTVPDMPFAIVLHGNGFGYDRYDYLQDHLAKNGIASASLNVMAANETQSSFQAAADNAQDFLDSQCFDDNFIAHFSSPEPIDFSKTAIIGHSRGGETARYLAANLVAHAHIDVQAVVALAPTHSTNKALTGSQTAAYLLLFGSDDPDPSPFGVFAAHDLAGWNEVSTPTALDLDRGMKFLEQGNHVHFSDPINPNEFVGGSQRAATKGYLNAFLRAWLKGDWQFYEGYIRGDSIPNAWSNAVLSQFSTKISRKVVDNFEDLNASPNTLGGTVSSVFMSSVSAVDATTLSTVTPHSGRVLRVQPSANNAYVTWSIPNGQRNFTSNLVLSLRIGQITGSGPVTARIGVKNGDVFQWVDLGAYGGIPEPMPICTVGLTSCEQVENLGTMRTIRIPVDDFGSVNDVQTIYLQFLTGAIGDQFIVDNLEFAEAWQIAF